MDRKITKLLPFLSLCAALALDPLSSVTDAQDGSAGQAPGEAPRPDVAPRGALLTGDVVADAPLGPIAVRVERVPGSGDRVRLVAKATGDETADLEVEVHCSRTTGSLASRMGPMPVEVATETHHVHVAKGEQQVIALTTGAPVPEGQPRRGSANDLREAFAPRTWWTYEIRLAGAQFAHVATPYVTQVALVDAPPPAPSVVHPLVAGSARQAGPAK